MAAFNIGGSHVGIIVTRGMHAGQMIEFELLCKERMSNVKKTFDVN